MRCPQCDVQLTAAGECDHCPATHDMRLTAEYMHAVKGATPSRLAQAEARYVRRRPELFGRPVHAWAATVLGHDPDDR